MPNSRFGHVRRNPAKLQDQTEFLPAALEIVARPPSPAARALWVAIASFVAIFFLWASIGEVDVVASARGTTVPEGRVPIINALEGGSVAAVFTAEGGSVEAGAAIISLDPIETDTDIARLHAESALASTAIGVFDELLHRLQVTRNNGAELVGERPLTFDELQLGAAGNQRAAAEWRQFSAAQRSIHEELNHLTAQHQSSLARLETLRAILPLVAERYEAQSRLMERGYSSRLAVLEIEQALIQYRGEQRALSSEALGLVAAIQQVEASSDELAGTYEVRWIEQRIAHQQTVQAAQLELERINSRGENRVVRSPIAGTVHQFQITNVGQAIHPGDRITEIVPVDSALSVLAYVPNAHAAMLEQSLPVNIKFDAYNAADYGSVPGLVRWISPNSIEHEEYGFVYEIEVEILVSNSTDPIDSRIILRPGLTATVDVKIGKRNLLEIFLEPLFRWRNEALREA